MIKGLIFIFLFVSIFVTSRSYSYQLYSGLASSYDDLPEVGLTDSEKKWLSENRIKVGFVKKDFPPYDISNDGYGMYYEGITADYLKFFELVLGTGTTLIAYDSRKDAIEAVKNDEIDVLTTSNDYEVLSGLKLTSPYQEDIPAVFKRSYSKTEKVKRIGIFYEYLPDEVIKRNYPDAEIVHYSSPLELVTALFKGDINAMIIDLNSANYQINSQFVDDISFDRLLEFNSKGFSFALHRDNDFLLDILNKAIFSVDGYLKGFLKRKWNGGGVSIPSISTLNAGRNIADKYLDSDKEVVVVLSKYLAPISYVGEDQDPQGILIEILELINLYTGVKFKYVFKDSIGERIQAIKEGEADFGFMTQSKDRGLYFTKEILSSNYSVVKKVSDKPEELSTVYVPNGHIYENDIKLVNPNLNIFSSNNYIDSLNRVFNSDNNSIAIMPLTVANYYISKFFEGELYVGDIVHNIPSGTLSFAIEPNNENMAKFLSEIMDYIPANDINVIINRWSKNALPVEQNWEDYQYTIYTIIISGSVILIIIVMSFSALIRAYRNRLDIKNRLLEQAEFIQVVIDSIPHPIYVKDKELNLTLYNRSFVNNFGYECESLLRKNNANDIRFMYFPVEAEKDHKEVLENNSPLYKDRVIYKNQRRFDYYHWIQPFTIKSRSDSTAGVVCGFIDISERVKLLDQLSDAKENAESANVAKSRFLATMSHEIRTPINAILGLLELTKKKYSIDKFDIESVDVAYQAARELLSLIGDILDISKIESGKIDLNPDSNKLKDTIYSIYRTYFYLASQKGLSFDLEFDERLDRDFFYDDSRLKQVLVNIVGNAIKFTAKGRVDLRVRLIEDNRRYNKVEICIVDQGIGIPEKSMGRIFQAFNQADNHTGYGGTGLGLMISKAICDLMSASFNIESKEGIGTKITILLDLEVSSENAESSTSHVKYEVGHDERYSVLIVDDYAPNRLLLGEQLKYLGHTVVQDCNGKDAFDSYKNNVIDVVITDCNMPEVDGYELTRWIRHYEKEKSITPVFIIGYTANAQKEVIDDALASGMNSCLFKPITIDDLNTAISDVVFGGGELKASKDSFGNSWLDRDKLEALTLGNLELNRRILKEVFRENDNDILELRLALERLELEECKKIAHKMKSGSNMIGCTMISKKCDEIEGSCSEDEMVAYIEELITLTLDVNKKIENELRSNQ